jgi:hypothetical protein
MIENLTAGILLTVNRLAQVTRCVGMTKDLMVHLAKLARLTPEEAAKDESLFRSIDSKASTLATSLTARRFYFKPEQGFTMENPAFGYDPRFLVTEFTSTMILRESQVALIGKVGLYTHIYTHTHTHIYIYIDHPHPSTSFSSKS